MALTDYSGLTINNPSTGIQFTKVTDSSADWASVANNTYFYDKADKLVHYKDSTGVVQEIFSGSGITVGTTAVTSGTDGRVFFQAGGVVQQDANFTYDNTLKRLGLKAVGTAATDIPLSISNSAGTVNLLQQTGVGSILARSNDTFSYAGLSYRSDGANGWSLTNSHSGYGQGTGIEVVGNAGIYFRNDGNRALSIATYSTGSFKTYGIWNWGSASGGQRLVIGESIFDPQVTLSGTGNLGIGTYTAGARLDVRAQGALSTDIAFRVRNSADTANIVQINGDGSQAWFDPANNAFTTIRSGASTLIQWGNGNFFNIGIGHGHTMTPTTLYNTLLGGNTTIGSTTNEAVRIGAYGIAVGVGTINIGYGSNTNGAYSIKIGRHSGASSFGGTNSIHIGKTTSGNDVTPDNVFMTYFDSQSSSTLTRSNGSFGLLGQQAYILSNGTGTFGTDTFMGNGGNTLVVRNHPNIPSLNIADSFQQYSADIVAGNAAPHFRTEVGDVIKLYKQSSAGIATVGDLVTILTNLGLLG
jgi:hypothetical protein